MKEKRKEEVHTESNSVIDASVNRGGKKQGVGSIIENLDWERRNLMSTSKIAYFLQDEISHLL